MDLERQKKRSRNRNLLRVLLFICISLIGCSLPERPEREFIANERLARYTRDIMECMYYCHQISGDLEYCKSVCIPVDREELEK